MLPTLKSGKATGIDEISNEMLKLVFSYLKEVILKLFNPILRSDFVPFMWGKGLISPIYKSVDKLDAGNYRGICVMSCPSKFFPLIMNEQLLKFVRSNEMLNHAQFGLKKKTGTMDHVFSLKTYINKYVSSEKREELYVCFVNFKKTYSSMWQQDSFSKL